MDRSTESVATTQTNLLQYYVHKDAVNWLRQMLDDNYGDIVTVYDQLYHCDFDDVQYVEIFGDVTKCFNVSRIINSLKNVVQYKMPWINDLLYYTMSRENLISIQENLQKISNELSYEIIQQTVTWFGQNDLYIINFDPKCGHDEFKMQIVNEFESRTASVIKPLFITHVFALHLASQPPCPMQTNILTAYCGAFLPYLSVNDLFALEIAIKDHRIPYYDDQLDMDIQHHLRKRLKMLYGNTFPETFEIGLLYHQTILSHFICKYYDRFTTIAVPLFLSDYEAALLSDMYQIEINYTSHTCTRLANETGASIISVSVNLENFSRKTSNTDYFNWKHEGTWKKCLTGYNPNQKLHVTIKVEDEIEYPSDLLCMLFSKLIILFKYHNPNKAFLYFISVDFNLVPSTTLASLFDIFGHVEFNSMGLDVNELLKILETFPLFSEVIARKCHIAPNDLQQFSVNSITVSLLRFIECEFDINAQLTIFETLTQESHVSLEYCYYLSTDVVGHCNAPFTVTDIEFINMKYETNILFKILKRFRSNTNFTFRNCFIIGSGEANSGCFLNPTTLKFICTSFEIDSFLEILAMCTEGSDVCFKNCNIPPLIVNPIIYSKVSTAVFIDMSFEVNNFLLILQLLPRCNNLFLIECSIIPTEDRIIDVAIYISTVLFTLTKCDVQGLVTILNNFSIPSCINFDDCEFYSTSKSSGSGCTRQPLILKFKKCQFDAVALFNILEHLHQGSQVLFDNCNITYKGGIAGNRKFKHLSNIQFTDVMFSFSDLISLLEKFDRRTTVTFSNCKIEKARHIFSTASIQLSVTLFRNMTFNKNTLFKLLKIYSESSEVYFSDCRILDYDRGRIFPLIGSFKLMRVDFINIEFTANVFLSILAKFPNNATLKIYNCHILPTNPNNVVTENLSDLILHFVSVTIEIKALLQLIQNLTQNSRVLFSNCEFEEGYDWIPTDISAMINCIIFSENLIFSPSLILFLKCIQSTEIFVQFYDCQLNNQNLIDICTKTPIFGNRLAVLGEHQINQTFLFQLALTYYYDKIKNVSDLTTEDKLEIPVHIMPIVSKIKCNFDWNEFQITCFPVNDMTMKLELLRNGLVFDLFDDLEILSEELYDCETYF